MHNSDDPVVIDTYAWIEYFKGSAEGVQAKKYIEGSAECCTPSVVIAELSDKYRREGIGEWDVRNRFMQLKTKILLLDATVADKAGELKQELKKTFKDAGLADAIVWAHAQRIGGRIVTGDKHLRNLKDAIDVTA